MTSDDERAAARAALMDVNMNGVYRSCQVFATGMRKAGGSIVNFSSVNGVVVCGKARPWDGRRLCA